MRVDCLDDGYVVVYVVWEIFGIDIDILNFNNLSLLGCFVDVLFDYFDDFEIIYDVSDCGIVNEKVGDIIEFINYIIGEV